MAYKQIVQAIKDLPWHTYDPKSIVYLSWVTAVEFAESLRLALEAYPENPDLQEMAAGELQTKNLSYDSYRQTGDHYQFLSYFLDKTVKHLEINDKVFRARKAYNEAVAVLGDKTARAMTIFSREQELSDIFKSILKAHEWHTPGLGYYRYYLERHVEIDSAEGGHAELTQSFELDEEVLEKFYTIRLELYKALEN